MSERNLEAFRESRTKLLDPDPGRGVALGSIRDVTWVHQRHAISQGYNSVLEMALDELAAELAELKTRVSVLEERFAGG